MIDLQKLGRRAIACKAWRWMPGMLSVEADFGDDDETDMVRVILIRGDRVGGYLYDYAGPGVGLGSWDVAADGEWSDVRAGPCGVCIPDLSDPATLGCLLHLVREAWGDPSMTLMWLVAKSGASIWVVSGRGEYGDESWHDTEAEALVAALEAAP